MPDMPETGKDAHEKNLAEALALVLDEFGRDVRAGVQGMQQLDVLLPKQAHEAVMDWPLTLKASMWAGRESGADVAAHAAFSLAALQDAGLLSPHGLPPDVGLGFDATLARLHAAAHAGSQAAALALADRFAHGIGVARNDQLALHYYSSAAHMLVTDVEASLSLGPAFRALDMRARHMDCGYTTDEERETSPDVLLYEEELALRGDPAMVSRQAWRRLMGVGVPRDYRAALRGFEDAAEMGDVAATYSVGYMHLQGLGLPGGEKNVTRARQQFEHARALGLPVAWCGLGSMHWGGQAFDHNFTSAMELFHLGAEADSPDCYLKIGLMYSMGLGVQTNATRAVEHMEAARKLGHWRAPFNLGLMYERPHEDGAVPQNVTAALANYRLLAVARGGWTLAVQGAADALDGGDEWGALAGMVLAAEQGSDVAAANAGWMLKRGLGFEGPKRVFMAARMLERAARQKHAGSRMELAQLLLEEEDLGPLRERARAARAWLREAVRARDPEGLTAVAWARQHGLHDWARNTSRAAEL
ncbi:hypothetical protein FOA52_006967 [Chlamydomonas sp. UWO 241]|nr:hypothetical protein FOA52_006967 [Chlamydomonas sp. UWO 241]